MVEEPMLPQSSLDELPPIDVEQRIRGLLSREKFAVLCTSGANLAYGSLIAYAVDPQLTTAVFSTPTTTRKFKLLKACKHVALLFDSRSQVGGELMKIEAVTATGHATRLTTGPHYQRMADLYRERHPYLTSFLNAESSALFEVEIVRYFHVWRFQEVRQWIPPRRA